MKNSIFICLLLSILFFFGCSSSSTNDNSSNSNLYKWSCKINGVPYSWEGSYPATTSNDGQCGYTASTGVNPTASMTMASASVSGFRSITCAISLTNTNSGLFTLNQNSLTNNSAFNIVINSSSTNFDVFSTSNSAQMNINIQSISPNSVTNSGLSGVGKVIGTFSGTVYSPTSGITKTITEGIFEAVRIN